MAAKTAITHLEDNAFLRTTRNGFGHFKDALCEADFSGRQISFSSQHSGVVVATDFFWQQAQLLVACAGIVLLPSGATLFFDVVTLSRFAAAMTKSGSFT